MGEPIFCPFCGPGQSIVECYQDDYGSWKVGCGRCGSHSGHRPKSDPEGREKVIAHWNRRPQSPRTMALEEAAKVAELFIMLPADECNVPFDEKRHADIITRRAVARGIAAAIRALASDSGHRNTENTSALVDQSDQNLDEAK